MSLRTGSMKVVGVTALVFSIGVGLGVGWKLGWFPVAYVPSASGTLADALVSDGEEPPDATPTSSEDPPDLAWAEDQIEPPVEEGVNEKAVTENAKPAELDEATMEAPLIRAPKSRANRPVRRPAEAPRRVEPAIYQADNDEAPRQKPAALQFDEPAEKPVANSSNRFASVEEKLAAGEFLAAHRELSKLYWNAKKPDVELMTRLDATAQKIFFSPQPHFIEPYVIQPGDQLRKVAASYKLSWEYLAQLNKTDPRRIREGQKLKVLKGPFSAVVCLHDFSLTIHLQGYYVKRYSVGIGKDGSSPIGKFAVLSKLENPQYTDPSGKVIEGDDPTNPLGERWIDLGDSYGIHGTIDPDSIGKAASRGCIRLRDADIKEVYNFLVKDSVVEIRE